MPSGNFWISNNIMKQQNFITLVDQIFSARQKDAAAYSSALEHKIDEMVYKLYGLTAEELRMAGMKTLVLNM
jgi:hypothetical protein